MLTIYSESRKSLLTSLPNWQENLPWMVNHHLAVLYVRNAVTDEELEEIRKLATSWDIMFIPFDYDPAWQTEVYQGGGGGGAYINWLLAYSIYFDFPELRGFKYFLRLDDDIQFHRMATQDFFEDMEKDEIRVGWVQHIPDNEVALQSSLFDDVQAYVNSSARTFPLSEIWPQVSVLENRGQHNQFNNWRPYLSAGCVEMYHTNVFRNEHYKAYLSSIHAAEQLKKPVYWEQELKTMWQQIYVPVDKWRSYACSLPVFHKTMDTVDHWFISSGCDFDNRQIIDRGYCDLDPEMRFC